MASLSFPDVNVWLALLLSKHIVHGAARAGFSRQATESSVLFCRSTQQSLLRLLTTDKVMQPYELAAMSNAQAWQAYEGFASDRRIVWAAEPRGVEPTWKRLAARDTASPKLWMDAYLAAFAIAGGHRLVTTDRAFAQFAGLDVVILST